MESGFLVSYATTLREGVGQWLYSLSGVVQRLGESFQGHSTTDGEQRRREKWPICNPVVNLVRAPARITKAARSTSLGQVFDRSSNPDSDTHTQVPTTHVSSIRLAPRVHTHHHNKHHRPTHARLQKPQARSSRTPNSTSI